jgi:hypothetical protein
LLRQRPTNQRSFRSDGTRSKAVQKPDGAGFRRNAEGVRDQQEDHGRLEEVDHLLAKHDRLQSAGSPIACFDGHMFGDFDWGDPLRVGSAEYRCGCAA